MDIEKIRHVAGQTEIKYKKRSKHGSQDVTINSDDPPRPELDQALQNLRPLLADTCGFDSAYAADIVIQSCRLQRRMKDDGSVTTSVLLSASRETGKSNFPLNINTPARPLPNEDNEEHEATIDAVNAEKVEALLEEARHFINGKRAQQELFGEEAA